MTLKEFKSQYADKFPTPAYLTRENVSCYDVDLSYMKQTFALEPYQVPAAFVLSRFNSVIYTDDMGTGKTPVSIASLSASYDLGYKKTIIVVLASILQQWEDSIKKFSSFTVSVVQGTREQRRKKYIEYYKGQTDILLCSYNTFYTDIETFKQLSCDTAMFDEADYFKSPDSLVWQCVRMLTHKTKRMVLITGTPFSGKPEDTFGIISIASKGKISAPQLYKQFCVMTEVKVPIYSKYGGGVRYIKQRVISKYVNLDKFRELCNQFIFGRTVEETGAKMPTIHLSFEYLEKTLALKKFEAMTLKGVFIREDKTSFKLNSVQKLSYLHRACHSLEMHYPTRTFSNPKMDTILQEIEFLPESEQVAIFCNFKKIPDKLYEILDAKGGCSRVTGDITGKARTNDIQKFKEGTNRFIIMTLAGYAGLDLNQTRYLFFLDVIYNKAKDNQIRRRIVRKNSIFDDVYIKYILYRDSVESAIEEMLQRRTEFLDFMVDDEESISKKILDKVQKATKVDLKRIS